MNEKYNILILNLILIVIQNQNLECFMEPLPIFKTQNIKNVEYNFSKDSIFIYYDLNKCYFNDNKFYYTQNDSGNKISIFDLNDDLLFQFAYNDFEVCFSYNKELNEDCINILTFKNYIVFIYNVSDSIQVLETFNLNDKKNFKFHLNNYKYVGSDAESPYFAFVNDSNASKINEIRIIKLNEDGSDTLSINIDKFINLIQSKKDSVIKIHYFDNNYFIYDDSLVYQSWFKKNIVLITDSLVNKKFEKIYFVKPFDCISFNNSLILATWKLETLNLKNDKKMNVFYEGILQLHNNGTYQYVFEDNDDYPFFVYYSNWNIIDFFIKGNFLLINYLSPSKINGESYGTSILIYDMITEKLIYEPIKYIDISK